MFPWQYCAKSGAVQKLSYLMVGEIMKLKQIIRYRTIGAHVIAPTTYDIEPIEDKVASRVLLK